MKINSILKIRSAF